MPIGKVTLTCSDPAGPCGSPLCSTCNPLRMFTDGTDTVIARSLDDVRDVLVAMGGGVEEFDHAATKVPDPHQLREIAVAAVVDPRTVKRALAGLPTRPSVLARIETALAAMGLSHLLPGGTR